MKIAITILVAFLCISGCQKKHEQVAEASKDNPNVDPPSGPLCTVHPYNTDGSIGINNTMDVTIQNFDTSKGDWANFFYKRWDKTEWAQYREGFFSPVTFKINQSIVTITCESCAVQMDWQIEAGINVCN